MQQKILGLDLGTNSIGWAISNTELLDNQLEKYGVITFQQGIHSQKGVEFSPAAERTTHRSLRRLYQARKYKQWETLEILIENGYCPLTINELDKWRKYEKGVGRIFPLTNTSFNNWIKLDFDGDGKPDYTSPYALRAELASEKIDFTQEKNKLKLGRALYHIAQHRGFKSSKKVKNDDVDVEEDLIGAERKRAKFIDELIEKHQVKTVGAAFHAEEKAGNRIRKNLHQHVIRKQLQNEVKYIFDFQGLNFEDIFKKPIHKSAIFWQRPLRSQKGTIGKCTLEPNKYRCPTSHPDFEEFRVLSFLNTIEFRNKNDKSSKWQKIPQELRNEIYKEKFFRISKPDFDFLEIREFIKKRNQHDNWELNYKDKTNVSACPVTARLKELFGNDWRNVTFIREPNPNAKTKKDYYDIEDIWHVLFSFEDDEDVRLFAEEKLQLENSDKFLTLWYKMPVAYSMLSLKAIRNILPFLREGMIYTEAALLGKVPEVIGVEKWAEHGNHLKNELSIIIDRNRSEKKLLNIANNLIAKYKAEEKFEFAKFNFEYQLQEDDKKLVLTTCEETYGKNTWQQTPVEEKQQVVNFVSDTYQSFFTDKKREYKKLPHLLDTLKNTLKNLYGINDKQLDKLYHPSQVTFYAPAKEEYCKEINRNVKLLGSPKTGAFKNPMAMRTLFELRKLVNYLLVTGQIDEETRIVVEVARELNDANMRWAIETYQRHRQEENKEFANAIIGLLEENPNAKADPSNSTDIDKFRLWFEQLDDEIIAEGKSERAKEEWGNNRSKAYKAITSVQTMIEKYRAWKQQECRCIYTGKIISISDLFSENRTDFEHTLPRSKSFDCSLANLTVCDFDYNRNIKKNQIPFNLDNYSEDAVINGKHFTAIKPRLDKWKQKVEDLKLRVEFWRTASKKASTEDLKKHAIRQKHLWTFELKYWQNKLGRFTMVEIKTGFKNSQLIDTQIISKYAYHFLKTSFNKVEVQKGIITDQFRKIYSIQPRFEKKDRTKHSHHAMDAAVLTFIPVAAKRDEILQRAFEQEEFYNEQYKEAPYKNFKTKYILEIENKILINNTSKDQALTPGKKRVRTRGKITYYINKDGNKQEKWSKGDSIRGQLHMETFYGKIKPAKHDDNGKPLKDDEGNWIYYDDNLGYRYVVRAEVNKDFKVANIVDPALKAIFNNQMAGRNLEKTLREDGGIWMLNKKGERVHIIRHVRCLANDVKEPLAIKKQTNLSEKEYKQDYWAKNGENYAYVLYKGIVKGKIERKFQPVNLFEAAKLKADGNIAIENEIAANKKGDKIPLYTIIKSGRRVLFYKDERPEELKELDSDNLLKRLYYVIKFAKDGRMVFGYHLDSKSDAQLKELEALHGNSIVSGFSQINFENPWPKLRLTPSNFNFIVENEEFLINKDGSIKFLF